MYLNRYRETYNLLTYSKAFKDTGQADNSKVNKNQWTPHNTRRICFDANGLLEVRYTTNNKQVKLVELQGFTQQKHPEMVMKEIMEGKVQREQKGMIDALHTNLVFSNIEEIVFFTGGFLIPEELGFELERLNKCITNIDLIKRSFKRLHTVLVVEQALTEQSAVSLKSNRTIEEQLRESGVKYEKYEIIPQPDRNEYGALNSFTLDSGEYRLDTPFSLTDDKKVKESMECRLSKWFEWSKEKAKREALKEANADKEDFDDTEEIDSKDTNVKQDVKKEYDGQLIKAVKSTLGKLESFYEPLWNDNFDGIFHDKGLRSVKEDKRFYENLIISAIYTSWKEVAGIKGDANDIDSVKPSLKADYSPGFHRKVLKNKKDWGNTKNSIYNNYLSLYSEHYPHNTEKINELEKKLTNCVVVTKWSKNQILLRFTGINKRDKDRFAELLRVNLKTTYLASSRPGMLANCEINESGVGTATYIIDYQEFKDELLFAHKAYTELGIKPELSNAVVGLKMNGNPITLNLTESNKILYSIIAGSGSGKGVMTMGLLATLYGAGASVVYLDYKPDIAGMLWDLEREYSSKGLRLLALDIGKEKHENTGSAAIRTGDLNLLSSDERYYSQFKTLRLAKLFQLVTLIGKDRTEIEKIIGKDISKLYFIIDELTSINTDFTQLQLYVKGKESEYRGKASKTKATEEDKMMADYYTTLNDIIEGMNIDFVQGVTKDWRMSGLKVILIGQQIGSNWKVDGKSLGTSFAGRALSATHMTISGVQQANLNNHSFTEDQELLAKQRGVFALTNGTPSSVDSTAAKTTGIPVERAENFEQFRSYFTLIENDFDPVMYKGLLETEGSIKSAIGRYVENKGGLGPVAQLFSGFINKDTNFLENLVREFYDFDTDRIKQEVTFSGLLKVMQETAGIDESTLLNNMNKGYDILDSLFRKLVISQNYNTLEEYLCDCSPGSVFTLNELKGMLGLGGAVYTPKLYHKVSDENENEDEDDYIDLFGELSSEEKPEQPKVNLNNNEGIKDFNYQDTTKRETKGNVSNTGNQTFNDNVRKSIHKEQPTRYSAHTDTLKISKENNPFIKYQGEGVISTVNSLREMTEIIMTDIRKLIGDYRAVKDFTITHNGQLIFNNVLYTPKIEEEVIDTFPVLMREKIRDGELIELFNLREVYKFKDLERLVIENHSLAQGRARKELGIGYRKRFSVLFNKFRNLSYINVGGVEYTRATPDTPGEEDFLLDSDGGLLSKIFGPKEPKQKLENKVGKRNTYVDNLLNSRPVKTVVGALGWTVGTQVVYGAAMLMGPWGLLFGALAMAGAYKEIKKSNPNIDSKKQSQTKSKK